jgi:predicted RNA binding protein YcfA (HicA-like mRNA interferase family)
VKLPRDISGRDLARALSRFGYEVSHQTGSHMRLTTRLEGEHHITIPAHSQLRIGTLSAILREVELHLGLSREDLLNKLLG